jgi:hypothetical protein
VQRWRADPAKTATIDGRMGGTPSTERITQDWSEHVHYLHVGAQRLIRRQVRGAAPCLSDSAGVSWRQRQTEGVDLKNKQMILIAGAILGAAVLAAAAQEKIASQDHSIVTAKDLKWNPIIKGCEISVVEGNPDAAGAPYVVRLHCLDGSKVPAHWHPEDEKLTVLKGVFLVGMGDSFDAKKLHPMNVGDFTVMPKETHHFALCKGDNIVQAHGIGPFKVNWINPSEVIPPDAKPTK